MIVTMAIFGSAKSLAYSSAQALGVVFGERIHRYSDEGAVPTDLGSSDTPTSVGTSRVQTR